MNRLLKIYHFVLIIAAAFFAGVFIWSYGFLPEEWEVKEYFSHYKVAGIQTEKPLGIVFLTITNPQDKKTIEVLIKGGESCLDIIQRALLKENLVIKTKQYEGRVLIEKIEDYANGDQGRYWNIYYNGKPATKDLKELKVKPADHIELRFE